MPSKFGGIPVTEETETTTTGSRFGGVPVEKTPPKEEEQGVADYLASLYGKAVSAPYKYLQAGVEGGLAMGTAALAPPVSGMAGLAKTITSGPEAGAETIKQIQEAIQYEPRSELAREAMGFPVKAAMAVPGAEYVAEKAMAVPENIGDLTYEGALKLGLSPDAAAYFGAAGKSAIPIAIELLGLKGSKTAKKGLLKNVIEKADKADFYDAAGNLKNEIKTAMKDADIDLAEVQDFLPENIISQKAAQPIAEQIKKTKIGRQRSATNLAETFQPDIEKIKAFEDLDIDFLPQDVAKNPTAAAIAENLQDIPGSMMSQKRKNIIEQLGKRADDIIIESGGTIEKGELQTRFKERLTSTIDDLGSEASKLYNEVGEAIPKNTQIETTNIIDIIKKRADDVGGEKYLTAKERSLLKNLDPETNPTYGRLDLIRRQVGEQLGGIDTPFKNVDRKTLGELYDALTNDQQAALLKHGDQPLLDKYLTGKTLVSRRKAIEKQAQNLLGKKLTADVTKKMGSAMKQLSEGNTAIFDSILDNIPKDLGTDLRRDVVASALNDAFTSGARAKGSMSVGGFGSYWKKLNRNPKAMARLKEELGSDAWKRVETIAKVNDSLKEAMALSVKTGRQLSTPGLFDEVNKIAQRAYGAVAKAGSKVPGVRTAFEEFVSGPKNARSIAADELLSDRRFQNFLKQQAMGKVNTAKKLSNVNRILENLKSYKNWKKTLPPTDIQDLAAVGVLGYFTGKQQESSQ